MTQISDFKPDKKQINDSVYILSQFTKIPNNLNYLGQFKMIENRNGYWDTVYSKLKKFAILNNANVIKIDEYHMNGGYGTKGNLGYVVGKLYEAKDLTELNGNNTDSNYLYISRYEKDYFISAGFNFDIYVNDKLLGNLSNKSMFKIKINLGDKIKLSTNKKSVYYNFEINQQRDYYIFVYKHIENKGVPGISIMISVGDVDFLELNPVIGKLEYENIIQVKEMLK